MYKDMRKKLCSVILFICMLLLCGGCGSDTAKREYEKQALYFDTVISLKFYAGENGDELMEHCLEICQNIEETFSRTRGDSELYQINHRTEDRVKVSGEMAELVSLGLEYYEKSGRKFDITIAPLSDLWDFKSEDAKVPPQKEIEAALAKVDASRVHVNGNVLVFDSNDTMLDLGALVKGYAADKLRTYLTENGVESGIINLGGNVLTIGSKPDTGEAWKIGIQKPFDSLGSMIAAVEVKNQTVVSSGIYERYFEQDGILYHHILDPDSGYPIRNNIWGVSVICESSLLGDVLSTTCLTLGIDEAVKLIDSMEGVEAIFVRDDLELIYTDEGMR